MKYLVSLQLGLGSPKPKSHGQLLARCSTLPRNTGIDFDFLWTGHHDTTPETIKET